jgi:hypothetical protein
MTDDNIKTMEEKIDNLRKEVSDIHLNISEHNTRHEADMEDLRPIIKAYKEKEAESKATDRLGKKAIFWATFVTSIGAALYILKDGFQYILGH